MYKCLEQDLILNRHYNTVLLFIIICPINQRSKLGFNFGLTSTDASIYMFMLMTEHSSMVVRIFKLPETKSEIHQQLTEGNFVVQRPTYNTFSRIPQDQVIEVLINRDTTRCSNRHGLAKTYCIQVDVFMCCQE